MSTPKTPFAIQHAAFAFIRAAAEKFDGTVAVCAPSFLAEGGDLASFRAVLGNFSTALITVATGLAGTDNEESKTLQLLCLESLTECTVHTAALSAIAIVESKTSGTTSGGSTSSVKEQKRQKLKDAAAHSNAIAERMHELKFGKLAEQSENHPHTSGTQLTELRQLVDNNEFGLIFKENEKNQVLRNLALAISAAVGKTTGNYISMEKMVAFLSNGDNCNVNLMFVLNSQSLKVGTKSGGARIQNKTTLNGDATTSTSSDLWRTLSVAQSENSNEVKYEGSAFVAAIRTWATLWFYLRAEMYVPIQSFLTQLSSLVRSSFGFELHQCSTFYNQEFLMSLFKLLDAMVAYSKKYGKSDFVVGLMNPLQTVSNGILPTNTEIVPNDCGIMLATVHLLSVMRDKHIEYARRNFRDIEDDLGARCVVSKEGRLLVHKNKYVSPIPVGAPTRPMKTLTLHSYTGTKTTVTGYSDSAGKLHIH